MLTVKDINVFYGPIHAIKGVSFEVKAGEVVALIGCQRRRQVHDTEDRVRPSAETGSIEFDGEDISKVDPHKIVKKALPTFRKDGASSCA